MAYTREGVPFASGSETSYEAALHAKTFIGEQGVRVFRWLKSRGEYGGTQREAEADIRISRQSLCARFKALEDAGAIRKTRVKRAACVVYQTTGSVPPEQLTLLGEG